MIPNVVTIYIARARDLVSLVARFIYHVYREREICSKKVIGV